MHLASPIYEGCLMSHNKQWIQACRPGCKDAHDLVTCLVDGTGDNLSQAMSTAAVGC
jgi:hypothetical protein